MLYILFLNSYILKRAHGLTCLIFTQPKPDPFIKQVSRVDLFLTKFIKPVYAQPNPV